MIEIICQILGIARRTYFHWQKSDGKASGIKLFNKYFTKEELEEFIETGSIKKQEMVKNISVEELELFNNFKKKLLNCNMKDDKLDEQYNINKEYLIKEKIKKMKEIEIEIEELKK